MYFVRRILPARLNHCVIASCGSIIYLVYFKSKMECVLTDLEEISSHTLSKGTFFSFAFDLQATLTTNYHKKTWK